MKNVLYAILISITVIGCKNNQSQEGKINDSDIKNESQEAKIDTTNQLELGCYEYKTDDNDFIMQITSITDKAVKAKLYYRYAEKDQNEGDFSGFLNGDKLMGDYIFMSEGKESTREVAFKVEKNQILEGFGDLDSNGTKFTNSADLTYGITTPWEKADCEQN